MVQVKSFWWNKWTFYSFAVGNFWKCACNCQQPLLPLSIALFLSFRFHVFEQYKCPAGKTELAGTSRFRLNWYTRFPPKESDVVFYPTKWGCLRRLGLVHLTSRSLTAQSPRTKRVNGDLHSIQVSIQRNTSLVNH